MFTDSSAFLSDPKEIMRETFTLLEKNGALTPGLAKAIENRAEEGLLGFEFIARFNRAISILKANELIETKWVLDLLMVPDPDQISGYAKAFCTLAQNNLLVLENWNTLKNAPVYFSLIVQVLAEAGLLNQANLNKLLEKSTLYSDDKPKLRLIGDGIKFYEVMAYLHEIGLMSQGNLNQLLNYYLCNMSKLLANLRELCRDFPAEKHQAIFNFLLKCFGVASTIIKLDLLSLENLDRFSANLEISEKIVYNFASNIKLEVLDSEDRQAILDNLFAVNVESVRDVTKAYNNLILANINLADFHAILREHDDYAILITEGLANLAKAGILNAEFTEYLIVYKPYADKLAEAFIILHQHALLNTYHINLILDNKQVAVNLAKFIVEDAERFQGIINNEVWEEVYERDAQLKACQVVKGFLDRCYDGYDPAELENAGSRIFDLAHIAKWIEHGLEEEGPTEDHQLYQCARHFVSNLSLMIEYASQFREAIDLSQAKGSEDCFVLFLMNIENCRELAVLVSLFDRVGIYNYLIKIYKNADILSQGDLVDSLSRLPADLLTKANVYHIFEICDNAQSVESGTIEVENYLNRISRQYIQAGRIIDRQSTHSASVHATVSSSAKKLADLYQEKINEIPKLEAVIESIKVYGNNQDDPILKRAIDDLSTHAYHHIDPASGISLRQLLALCWLAIHDDTHRIGSREDALNAFNQGLIENQREYNDVVDEEDAPSCLSGAFNKLIEILYGHHPHVELVLITMTGFSIKLPRVVKEEAVAYLNMLSTEEARLILEGIDATKDASSLWTMIRDKVANRMLGEFGSLFTSPQDPRFIDNLEIGSQTELKLEELMERVSPPALAMVMGSSAAIGGCVETKERAP